MLLNWFAPSAASSAGTDQRPRLALITRGLRRIATLPALLPEWSLVHGLPARHAHAVLAWGHKPSAQIAEAFAQRQGINILRVEDGFLRSVGLGNTCPPLSIVLDPEGIYYHAAHPSRLENLIATPLSPAQACRAQTLQQTWVQSRVSKYNHGPDRLPPSLQAQAAKQPVLVIDQTAGDASIQGSGANAADFAHMLAAALDEHPHAPVWLKVHPDVVAGRKQGHFDLSGLSPAVASRVTLIADDVHPPALLEVCRAVYVVSSQMGFEALLWSRPVRCFGMPFYAGWGLTQDARPAPLRRQPHRPSLDALTHAALISYPRYLDPETGQRCEAEHTLAHIALQRQHRARFPTPVQVLGLSRWKRPIAAGFLQGTPLRFVQQEQALTAGHTVAVWGRTVLRTEPTWAGQPNRPDRDEHLGAPPEHNTPQHSVLRIEDGFIRSVGLGADLVRPLSWVIDDVGIYFDATQPSRLEALLQSHPFDETLRQRAAKLRQDIVQAGLTKYNVGQGQWQRPATAARVILVPGQVETDASIRWGAADIRTNLDLLRAVRTHAPDAYLVYKPHPDVMAGLRHGGAAWAQTRAQFTALCDAIVIDVPMHDLLTQVDEVHTLTSLTGFEALMRGKIVHTWGLPFYAGWGLTHDHAPTDSPALRRRQRSLSIDAMVAAALILYPSYLSRHSGAFTTPERALQELREWQALEPASVSPARRAWRWLKRQTLGQMARRRGR